MTKKEYQKLNTVKTLLLADVKTVSNHKVYQWGYKHGFNVCRRRIRKALGVLATNKDP
jgi:hypothetical protein